MKKVIILFVIMVSGFGCKKNADEIKGVIVNLIANDDPRADDVDWWQEILFKKQIVPRNCRYDQ